MPMIENANAIVSMSWQFAVEHICEQQEEEKEMFAPKTPS